MPEDEKVRGLPGSPAPGGGYGGASISYPVLSVWLLAASVVAGFGSYLTYESSWSSEAWQSWAGSNAWKRDFLRAAIAGLLGIWIVSQLGLKKGRGGLNFVFPRAGVEWIWFLGLLAMFLWLALLRLPAGFEEALGNAEYFAEGGIYAQNRELKAVHDSIRNDPSFDHFVQLKRPALLFLIYAVGFWWGIVWPIFLLLLRAIGNDSRQRRLSLEGFRDAAAKALQWEEDSMTEARKVFEKLQVAFRLHEGVLAKSAQRYPTIVLILIVGFLYEQLTPSGKTLLPESIEFGKLVLWLMIGPSLVAFFVVALFGYQKLSDQYKESLRALAWKLSREGGHTDLNQKVIVELDLILWERSPASFVLSVVRTANFGIPLMISLVGYVIHTYTRGEWVELFAPKMVIDFVESIFR